MAWRTGSRASGESLRSSVPRRAEMLLRKPGLIQRMKLASTTLSLLVSRIRRWAGALQRFVIDENQKNNKQIMGLVESFHARCLHF
ncbi:hypothetical protein D3C85_1668330 [compost metagenome]